MYNNKMSAVSWIDPAIWSAYQTGIVVGLLIASTLSFFPGRKPSEKVDSSNESRNDLLANRITSPQSSSSLENPKTTIGEQQSQRLQRDAALFWTPHRRLNTAVYAILTVVTILVIMHTYSDNNIRPARSPDSIPESAAWRFKDHPWTLAFRAYFPKEASILFQTAKPTGTSTIKKSTF